MEPLSLVESLYVRCGCHVKKLAFFTVPLVFIVVTVLYQNPWLSIVSGLAALLFWGLAYYFYLLNKDYHKDQLLALLDKNGRKKLEIPDDALSLHFYKKKEKCNLPDEPDNVKSCALSIIYLTEEHLTLYTNCPPSHIYTVKRKTTPKKDKGKIADACDFNIEFYFSYIQGIHFDKTSKKVYITLNSNQQYEFESEKKPAEKAINIIRNRLRTTEREWVEHARSSY